MAALTSFVVEADRIEEDRLRAKDIRAGALGLALCACSALSSTLVRAETRALIVGIDDYANVRRLRGAVNDAQDIAIALRKRGVQDLTILTDAGATRASVLGALEGLIARTQPGDLVTISFAGHGSRETWGAQHPPDVQAGDTYEVFLLRDFTPPDSTGRVPVGSRTGFGERILGREMRALFTRLEQRGARTVFVADTCHGGGLSRSVAAGAPEQSYRAVPPYPTPPDGDDPRAPEAVISTDKFDHLQALPSLTFLAAVSSRETSPEVEIPAASRTMRGALSYAFARMIEGEGDANRDGVVTRYEAFQFIRSTVKQYAQFRQTPELQPSDERLGSRPVIDFPRDIGATPPPPVYKPPSHVVRVFVDGDQQQIASQGRTGDLEIASTRVRDEADLIWDPRRRTVVSRLGDLVADNIGPEHLDAIAEREVARRDLLALGQTRPPSEINLEQGDRRYCEGEVVRAQAQTADDADPNYILFNISGDGTIQYLYPRTDKHDPPKLRRAKPFFEMKAVQPFGADTLVLIVSNAPLDALANKLQVLDGERASMDAVTRVKASGGDIRVTTQSIFTAERRVTAGAAISCGTR